MLIQLANAIPEVPFGWSVLLAPALMISLVVRERQEPSPRRGWAQALLVVGLTIQLIGLAGGSPGMARVGLPISVMGLALWTGVPSITAAVLAFWAMPIPVTLYGLTTPNLESAYAQLGAAMVGALGADISASGPLIRSGAERLELDPYHSGIHLIFVITELSWYAAARRGLPPMVALARTAGATLLAIPLQLFAVWVAVLLLAAGASGVAHLWLDHGVWLLTAILGVVWIETKCV